MMSQIQISTTLTLCIIVNDLIGFIRNLVLLLNTPLERRVLLLILSVYLCVAALPAILSTGCMFNLNIL